MAKYRHRWYSGPSTLLLTVQEKLVRPNSKAKSTKAVSKTNKNAPPPAETSQSEKKRGRPPAPAAEVRRRDAAFHCYPP